MVASRCRVDLLDASGRMKNMRIEKLSAIARTNVIASGLMVDAFFSIPSLYFDGMVEKVEPERYSGGLEAFSELRHDAGGVEAAFDVSAGPESELLEQVDVLKADHVSAGPGNLADVGDTAGPVAHARNLDDEVNGGGYLGANGLLRQRD